MNDQEDNLIKIEEENLKHKSKYKINERKDSDDDEDVNSKKFKPINDLGLQNLVNLHDHISRMIKEKSQDD